MFENLSEGGQRALLRLGGIPNPRSLSDIQMASAQHEPDLSEKKRGVLKRPYFRVLGSTRAKNRESVFAKAWKKI